MRRRVSSLLVLFLFLLLFPVILCAQSPNASLTGRVIDSSKARIAGVKVAAINAATKIRFEVTTNTVGEYYLSSLHPGTYRIEVEKAGFKKLVRPDVILHVQDALDIDFEMTVGSASESISVEGGGPLMNTESASVSTVVDHTFIDHLPLNGRTFQNLILLTPGVVPTQTSLADQGQFSVNGQRADANYFSVDGVSANFGLTGYFPLVQTAGGGLPALSATGGTNSLVSVDAMEEFRVQTSSFAPEFGRTPGGQVSIVTRSGTNRLHGTLFEYFRNGDLDANDWFADLNHLPKPEERQNVFGGVFGGPILKDKTFFFFSYEGLRLRQPFTQESLVPDSASRQLAPAAMQPFLNAYPVPNGSAAGPGLAEFNASYSNPSSLDAYSFRVDHIVNAKFNLFARYAYSPSNLQERDAPFTISTLSTKALISSTLHTFTVGLTELIKPTINNEVRLNYSNSRLATDYDMDDFGGAVPLPDSLLFPAGFSSADSAFLFDILGVGEYGRGKSATDEQRQINVIDNLSLTKSSHQLKFGMDYRWLSPFTSPFAYRQFAAFFGVACPAPPQSCGGYALSGTVPGADTTVFFAQPASFQATALLSQNFSFYGQDTWKITPRIMLTYGLRWDINPPLRGKNSASDPFTVIDLNDPAIMTLAPRGTPLYQTTYGNVAPRLGFVYQFNDSAGWGSVLRAGFGVFNDIGQGSLGGSTAFFPYSATNTFVQVPFPLSSQDAAPPAITDNPPVSTMLVADPHLKLPRTYQWNVAVEQSIGSKQSVSLTYIGATGRDLLRVTNLYNANPDFSFVGVTDNTATSDYHALQLKFERRLSRGLQVLASYTWSHSIDISSSDTAAGELSTPASVSDPKIDRGNSDFDIRHSFTAGVTCDLPAPRSRPAVHTILGGWSLDSVVFARSAPPVDVVGGTMLADGIALTPRPNVNPGVSLELHSPRYPGGKIFNSAAFTPVSSGQGDFGRNVLRGFGSAQLDLALQRRFHLSEAIDLRFRAEFFNIFNHPNFGSPINSLSSSVFGYSTETLANSLGSGGANGGLNPLYQIGGPRSIQLSLKLQF